MKRSVMIAILVMVGLLVSCADSQAAKMPTAVATPTAASAEPIPGFWSEGTKLIISSEVKVLGFSRQPMLPLFGQEFWPRDESEEFLITYLLLPSGTTQEAIYMTWLEDGATHGPRVVGQDGHQTTWAISYPVVASEKGVGYVLVFLMKKDIGAPDLVFPDGFRIDLAAVPDLTPSKPFKSEPGLKRV